MIVPSLHRLNYCLTKRASIYPMYSSLVKTRSYYLLQFSVIRWIAKGFVGGIGFQCIRFTQAKVWG